MTEILFSIFMSSRSVVGTGASRGMLRHCSSAAATSARGTTKSIFSTFSTALCGMPVYMASRGDCTMAMPPTRLMASRPAVPSSNDPLRMTPMAPLP